MKEIYEYSKKLKLPYLQHHFQKEYELAEQHNLNRIEFVKNLLKNEVFLRSERSKLQRIKNANFPYKKYLSELDENRIPNDGLKKLNELKTLEFIRKSQNVIEYGNPGTGKTHIAVGLGIEAALAGYSVKFYSVPTLITLLKELKSQKNLLSIQKQFETVDLLILDELGYISFDKEGGELLFTHLSMRSERKSTIITTNLSFDKWTTIFNDPVLTTAIVDRMTHNSYVINMIGETNRKRKT